MKLPFSFLPEYQDDDEYIPKNTSLVVKRVPAKTAATSLIARLRGSANGPHAQAGARAAVAAGAAASAGSSDGAIFMPVKAEEAFVETTVRPAHDDNNNNNKHRLFRYNYHCSCCGSHSRCDDFDSNRDSNFPIIIAIIICDVIFVQFIFMFTNKLIASCFNYLPPFNCCLFSCSSPPPSQSHPLPLFSSSSPNNIVFPGQIII